MDQPLCPGCSHRDRHIDELNKRLADLEKRLDEKDRAGKRQAAPFSKGEPTPTPKKPGRKAGPNHDPHGHRPPPPPETITATLEAPLPQACPHCGGSLAEDADVDEQFQTDLPTQPIGRKFRIHKGCCTKCGRRVCGHHPLQTSDATAAAQSQIGPNAQAAIVYLNKRSGMSYGKIAAFFQHANGIDLQPSTATRIVLRTAEQRQRRLSVRPRCNEDNDLFAAHLYDYAEAWFTFLLEPARPATNHEAEQALRTPIVNRKVFGGNRTAAGCQAQVIIRSTIQTCKQQQRSAFGFLRDAISGVVRSIFQAEESQVWYTLSSAAVEVPLSAVVDAHSRRHGVEEVLQAGKGEVGLAHYEVRSWVGWHHHMTLSLLALWFLILEKGRLGKKIPALTLPQMREVFARLLQAEPPSAERIAEEVSRVLRRNEEARIYHWHAATGRFPPRRGQPDG